MRYPNASWPQSPAAQHNSLYAARLALGLEPFVLCLDTHAYAAHQQDTNVSHETDVQSCLDRLEDFFTHSDHAEYDAYVYDATLAAHEDEMKCMRSHAR